MKHEWRKKEKNYYIPKAKPGIVDVEEFKFIQIKGAGNPNSEDFQERVGTLYSVAYPIKMMLKKGEAPEDYTDYVVYPLEGIWDLTEEAKEKNIFDKDELVYTIMIRQPNFISNEIFEEGIKIAKSKKENKLLDEVEFVTIEEGMCVQMMHIGSFDEEAKTFEVMEKFCEENNLTIKSKAHREIYISDFRKTAPEKLKTVLRYRVEKNNVQK